MIFSAKKWNNGKELKAVEARLRTVQPLIKNIGNYRKLKPVWDSYTKEKGFGGQNAMNSFNHYSFGSVLSWLYHTGLGIQRDETKPGYQHILLKPQPGPLEFMKGSVDSPYGVISAGWERKGDKIEYQVTIPVNTTATLFKNTEDPADTVELGSGAYTFML